MIMGSGGHTVGSRPRAKDATNVQSISISCSMHNRQRCNSCINSVSSAKYIPDLVPHV